MPWAVDYLIVGAGFAGSVLAERLASQMGKSCLVVDRRRHIAGNAYDSYDSAGVLVHNYGPHYFRTNSDRIVRYLSQFTEWRPADYRIRVWTGGRFWQFPINLNTFEQFIGRRSTSQEMEVALAKWRISIAEPMNAEDEIISRVGVAWYEQFFKNYTRKQWGRDPKKLDPSLCKRIPIRTNREDSYLSEKFQALPGNGYTELFKRMLDHPRIQVVLGTNFREIRTKVRCKHLIYTGPIDEYYDRCFGSLPYRSLRFERETLEREYFQPVVQVNYPNDHEFTRIVEFKHLMHQKPPVTTIVREYPQNGGPEREPYYPIPAPDARKLYRRYEELAAREKNVTFAGRLATYRYYNMDQVVGMALAVFEKLRKPSGNHPISRGESGENRPDNYTDLPLQVLHSPR